MARKPPEPAKAGSDLSPITAPPQEVLGRLEPFIMPEHAEEAAGVLSLMIRQSHSGPLPSAREFAGYEKTLEGAADRILTMAESEQSHRQELESTVIRAEAKMRGRGQILAILALLVMLTVVGLFAKWGHPVAGATLGSAVVIGVVALFLGQKWSPSAQDRSSETKSED